MVKSAYIHIPFCKSKCHYCSFTSFCNLTSKKDYIKTLVEEIKFFYKNEPLNTLYIGGGTPSLLEIKELEAILRLFNLKTDAEVTIEVNPEDVNYLYFRSLYDMGINRISMGCQSFDDYILDKINRRHNSIKVVDAVTSAMNSGFKNISLDFIYGLPNQTKQGFLSDLKKGIDLGINHVSLYGLKLEEGCFFYNNMPENLPDDDMQADMYLDAVAFLERNGFNQYEVSNFSKPKFQSRHNTVYWNNEEYYGFGVGAHGYLNDVRYENLNNISDYINNFAIKKDTKILTFKEKLEEEIFLGLRKTKGINIAEINSKYNIDFEEKYKSVTEKYTCLNLLKKTEDGYKLTLNGILVSNVILADFID